MSANELEIFLRLPGKGPQAIFGGPNETLGTLLSRFDIESHSDVFVFVGECEDALHAPESVENGADAHTPADFNRTLDELEMEKHRHIHCHNCPEINTTMHFSGKTLNRKFSPAATIEVATKWACMNLRLDQAAASEFVLRISGSENQPRQSQHLGELVKGGECAVSFELVKELTPQG